MNITLADIPTTYINLKEDVEKRKNIESTLSSMGIKSVERFEGIRHKKGNAGCSMSHDRLLNTLKVPHLVLEDDCVVKRTIQTLEIPDDADAVYLGISSWGRMNSHSGPFVQWGKVDKFPHLLRIWNMLSAHAILYLNEEYLKLCQRAAHYAAQRPCDYHDIYIAEIQKYFSIYAVNDPIFYQTSSNGTYDPLDTYPTHYIMQVNPNYWLPCGIGI